MAVRPIVRFPDPRLRLVAKPVSDITADVRELARDLADTMAAAPGVGITAPHIGVLLRVMVIRLDGDSEPRTYLNPEITWSSPDRMRHAEGSVSMPGVTDELERPAGVRMRYRDLDGTEQEEDATGFRAICYQHEIDQLDGVFWIDRLSRLKRERLIKRFEKLHRA